VVFLVFLIFLASDHQCGVVVREGIQLERTDAVLVEVRMKRQGRGRWSRSG